MVDKPDKQIPPDAGSEQDKEQQGNSTPEEFAGWHEPPVEPGSPRPALTGAWYTPQNAVPEPESVPSETEPGAEQSPAELEMPGAAPAQEGAWYVPTSEAEPTAETGAAAETPRVAQASSPAPKPAQPGSESQTPQASQTPAQPQPGPASPAEPTAQAEPEIQSEAASQEPITPIPQDTQVQGLGQTQAQPAAAGQSIRTPGAPVVQEATASREQAVSQPQGSLSQDTTPVEQQATRLLPSQDTGTPKPGSIQSVTEEPAITPESTPQPQSTEPQPVSPGLSPAEAAMLAEQRARGLADAGQPPASAQPSARPPASAPSTPSAPSMPTPALERKTPQPALPAAQAQPVVPLPPPTPAPTAFEEVERKVKTLRQQYQAGRITREQFQNELRHLMILGDDGRWWMLGVESDRWYNYDGREWVAANPPGYEERIRGSGVRTETGVQEVAPGAASTPATFQETAASTPAGTAEDSLPLPKRVPQVDPAATLVSPSTPFLEPVRPSEAATQQKARQVDASAESGGYIPSPQGGQQLPSRPAQGAPPGSADLTMRAGTVSPDLTVVRGAPGTGQAPAPSAAPGGPGQPPQRKPQYRIGEFPQPDYTEALGSARDRNFYVKWGIRIGFATIVGGMALTLIMLLAMIGFYFYEVGRYKQAVASLKDRAASFETTLIMDKNGQVLAQFNNPNTGQRTSVPLSEISPWLIDATISTENETFYSDPGFSVSAIIRAVYQNLRAGNTVSGASTITQQLARALVLDTELSSQRTTGRKIVEIIVASEIKRKYSKNEILQIYLNEIFYGNFAYGAEAASQTYFHKPASDLNPIEAAFLAGLPQSPATYDPVVNREAAMSRMLTVLRLMSEANGSGCIYIQHDDATKWGVPKGGGLCIIAKPQPDGSTLYYYQTPNDAEPQELSLELAMVQTATFKRPEFKAKHPHFVNYVWQQLEDKYGSQAIYSAGYRVYTTLDETIQSAAEQSVTQRLGELQARGINASNGSVVVMRPSDGAVVAMVGSADYYNDQIDGQVNVAFTAQQPGSSIKPFVYLTAFEPDAQGRYWTPATVIWDVYSDFNGYVPTNYDGQYHGPKTVRLALANSLNVPAVKTMSFVGVDRFTEMANRIGLQFPLGDPVKRQAGLTTGLGSVEVRLFDMTAGYAMLANNGRRVDPYAILYIQDSKGNEIYRADTSPAGLQIVNPEYAFLITSILSDRDARSAEFGYGWPLELADGRPTAVKTGTSGTPESINDNWTIGYTPDYVVGVWVGNSDNSPMYGVSGISGAAPIWNDVMTVAHQGIGPKQFTQPAGITQKQVCDDSGAEPSPGCDGRVHTEIFASSAPPPPAAQDIFRTVQIDEFTGKLANQSCSDDVKTANFVAIDDPAAVAWINNTPEGNTWAQQRGIQTPISQPPTDYCDPNQPRPYVVVSSPVQNATVQGILTLSGTVNMPNFHHYEIRYGVSFTPASFSDPLVVQTTQWTQPDSPLGQFDTRTLQNGQYTLRLIVYDTQGRSVTRDIQINVNNAASAPVPTAAPTLTPVPQGIPPQGAPTQAAPTPILAPTWTPIGSGQ